MNKKILYTIGLFLLFVPFRLPISLLFIHTFEWIFDATVTDVIPKGVRIANIVVTKAVYNLAISAALCYNIEVLSQKAMGRKASDDTIYWWTFVAIILSVLFLIIDCASVIGIMDPDPSTN